MLIELEEYENILKISPANWDEFEILLTNLIEAWLIYMHFWHLNKIFKEQDESLLKELFEEKPAKKKKKKSNK